MQQLTEPLLRDAAPERSPAGTARLLLTSHVLTKFGSKAWEVCVTTPARMPIGRYVLQPQPMPQPCDALLSRQTSRSCEQFATPLLLLEFSPGDLAAPSVFGLSVLLFKVRRRRPSTHIPGSPCARHRCLRLRLHHSVCPRLHPALHAYTRLALHTHVRMPSLAHPLSVDPSYPPLVPSSYPPGALLVPSSYPPRTLLPVYLRADVRQLDG